MIIILRLSLTLGFIYNVANALWIEYNAMSAIHQILASQHSV